MSKYSNKNISELISSINYSIKELNRRGIQLTNYDNNAEQLKGVNILGGKVKYMVQAESLQDTQHDA